MTPVKVRFRLKLFREYLEQSFPGRAEGLLELLLRGVSFGELIEFFDDELEPSPKAHASKVLSEARRFGWDLPKTSPYKLQNWSQVQYVGESHPKVVSSIPTYEELQAIIRRDRSPKEMSIRSLAAWPLWFLLRRKISGRLEDVLWGKRQTLCGWTFSPEIDPVLEVFRFFRASKPRSYVLNLPWDSEDELRRRGSRWGFTVSKISEYLVDIPDELEDFVLRDDRSKLPFLTCQEVPRVDLGRHFQVFFRGKGPVYEALVDQSPYPEYVGTWGILWSKISPGISDRLILGVLGQKLGAVDLIVPTFSGGGTSTYFLRVQ
jgi:hypothetical protein